MDHEFSEVDHLTHKLVMESITSVMRYIIPLTELLVESGTLDPNRLLIRMGGVRLEHDGSIAIENSVKFIMEARLEAYVRDEKRRFARIKRRSSKNGLRVERRKGVSRYGWTGNEYVVNERFDVPPKSMMSSEMVAAIQKEADEDGLPF